MNQTSLRCQNLFCSSTNGIISYCCKKPAITVKSKPRCPFCAAPHNPSLCESFKCAKQRCDILYQNKLYQGTTRCQCVTRDIVATIARENTTLVSAPTANTMALQTQNSQSNCQLSNRTLLPSHFCQHYFGLFCFLVSDCSTTVCLLKTASAMGPIILELNYCSMRSPRDHLLLKPQPRPWSM